MRYSIAIFTALAAAVPATAGTLFSENFQSVTGPGTNFGAGEHVGQFLVVQNDVDVFGTPISPYARGPAGNTCLDLNGNANGGIRSQSLSLTPGILYTVSFDLGGNGEPYYPGPTYPYALDVSFAGTTKSFSVAPLAPLATRSFDVLATSLFSTLDLTSTSSSLPTFWGPVLDNIRVTYADPPAAAVPEPASWAMMVAGFGLLGGALRRRRTAAGAIFPPAHWAIG